MKTEEEVLTLERVLPELGEAYVEWKASEKDKNNRKEEFFTLANAILADRGLAMKVVDMEAADEEIAKERVQRHYPGWKIDLIRPHRVFQNSYEVVVTEDPSMKAFSAEHEGVKYARQVRKGTVLVDDDWLKESDSDLYEEVTFELPWGDRVVRPLDQMEKETVGRLAKYIYNGKPSISLAAPRPVKEDK